MLAKILNGLGKFKPQNFNDFLCLVLISLITIMWVLTGRKIIVLPDSIIGALIVTWTLLVQYYFRKSKTEI